jgi:hypothetical protein
MVAQPAEQAFNLLLVRVLFQRYDHFLFFLVFPSRENGLAHLGAGPSSDRVHLVIHLSQCAHAAPAVKPK